MNTRLKRKLNCRKLTRGRIKNCQYVRTEPERLFVKEITTKSGDVKNKYKKNKNSKVLYQIKLI